MPRKRTVPRVECICEGCGKQFEETVNRVNKGKGRYCSRHCRDNRPGKTLPAERLWSQLEESGDCWLWPGGIVDNSYGHISIDGRRQLTHRLAWELTFGPIPNGMFVCHHCDNPPCCNPNHLFLGTHDDNMRDAVQKGRAHPGERHGMARLTEAQVIEIRSRYKPGIISYRALAVEYGVAEMTVVNVVHRKTWRHI